MGLDPPNPGGIFLERSQLGAITCPDVLGDETTEKTLLAHARGDFSKAGSVIQNRASLPF